MKTFLESLKKELKKRKISQREIDEIISDHEEMIESAIADGLKEEEIKEKFGNPEQLAEELVGFSEKERKMEQKDFELFKEFTITDLDNVVIKLVNADFTYHEDDESTIRVFAKNLKHPEDYVAEYDGNTFTLRRERKLSFSIGTRKSPDFKILVPKGQELEAVEIGTTNGDCVLGNLHTKKLHIQTTNGDMEIAKVKAETFEVKGVNGDLKLEEVECKTLKLNTISGDAELRAVNVEGDVDVNTVSGDLELDTFNCDNAAFRTVSGDVDAKEFYPNTLKLKSVSGDVTVSNSDKTHQIEVKKRSVSGDVTIN